MSTAPIYIENDLEVWDYTLPLHPLAEVVHCLPEAKQEFAKSLLSALESGNISQKQSFWMDKVYTDFLKSFPKNKNTS